jgi:hypothetical protein
MIENPIVLPNGYGIRDPQELMNDHPIEDELGTEIFTGDEILVSQDGDIVLPENAVEYLVRMLGFEKKIAGE